jgi:hypothetical protein
MFTLSSRLAGEVPPASPVATPNGFVRESILTFD